MKYRTLLRSFPLWRKKQKLQIFWKYSLEKMLLKQWKLKHNFPLILGWSESPYSKERVIILLYVQIN